MKYGLTIGIVVSAAVFLAPNLWFARSLQGQIVDEDGKAVLNAVLLETWVARGRLNGSNDYLYSQETTSDENGRFIFPSWGPKVSARIFAAMFQSDPVIWIVKSGFQPLRMPNATGMRATQTRYLDASANDSIVIIRLKRHMANSPDQGEVREFALQAWGTGYGAKTCPWQNSTSKFAHEVLALETETAVPAPTFRLDHLCAYNFL